MEKECRGVVVASMKGQNITRTKLGKGIIQVFDGQLPAGMVVEGYYSRKYRNFQIVDVTYSSVLRENIHLGEGPLQRTPEKVILVPDDYELSSEGKQKIDPEDYETVHLETDPQIYLPAIPCQVEEGDFESLPPDDWCLEEIPLGQRFMVFGAISPTRISVDLRDVPFDVRRRVVMNVCKTIGIPVISPVTLVNSNFPKFIRESQRNWTDIIGIMAKKRNAVYNLHGDSPEDHGYHSGWMFRKFKKNWKS